MSSRNVPGEAPSGDVSDNSYVNRTGTKHQPVQVTSDTERIESGVDERTADSDAQLERDDREAIDKSNIIDERTRGAQPEGSYREPGDEEGLPSDDGTSSGDALTADRRER